MTETTRVSTSLQRDEKFIYTLRFNLLVVTFRSLNGYSHFVVSNIAERRSLTFRQIPKL